MLESHVERERERERSETVAETLELYSRVVVVDARRRGSSWSRPKRSYLAPRAQVIKAEKQTFTILGTPEYLSPECVLGQGYRFDVDLWAFGVLCYEMLLGYSPFSPDDPDDTMAVFQLVCTGTVKIPSSVSKPHRDFVLQLLMRNRNQRLGFAKGAEGIKLNPVFKDFNLPLGWDMLRQKKLKAPYKPTLRSKTDTSAFDTYDEECNLPVYLGDQEPFKEFGAVLVDDTSQIGKQPNV